MADEKIKPWYETGSRPPIPDAEQSAHLAGAMGQVMQVIAESMDAVYDAADGIRVQLAARGYSETAAEQVALQHIMLAQQSLWIGGDK